MSSGNLFHNRIVQERKLYLYTSIHIVDPIWMNLRALLRSVVITPLSVIHTSFFTVYAPSNAYSISPVYRCRCASFTPLHAAGPFCYRGRGFGLIGNHLLQTPWLASSCCQMGWWILCGHRVDSLLPFLLCFAQPSLGCVELGLH